MNTRDVSGVSLTYATVPSTTTRHTTTIPLYDWEDLYGLGLDALEAKLAELKRKNQKWLEGRANLRKPHQAAGEQPLVELLLAQQENKTNEHNKFDGLLAVTYTYTNVYDSFKLRYNQHPMQNLGK